jgi:hypothetical protein
MASTVIDTIAASLRAKLAGLTLTSYTGGGTKALTAYKWTRRDFSDLPCAVVGIPEVHRVGLDQPEHQIGSSEWSLVYPVSIYFDITEAVQMQALAVEAAELLIKAIDNDSQLSGTVDDAKVTDVTPFTEPDRRRPLAGYECTVEILKQVAYG